MLKKMLEVSLEHFLQFFAKLLRREKAGFTFIDLTRSYEYIFIHPSPSPKSASADALLLIEVPLLESVFLVIYEGTPSHYLFCG